MTRISARTVFLRANIVWIKKIAHYVLIIHGCINMIVSQYALISSTTTQMVCAVIARTLAKHAPP